MPATRSPGARRARFQAERPPPSGERRKPAWSPRKRPRTRGISGSDRASFLRAERAQTISHLRMCPAAAMNGPAERRALPDGVADIEPRAALDQKPHHLFMAAQHGLVQWRAMRMVAL